MRVATRSNMQPGPIHTFGILRLRHLMRGGGRRGGSIIWLDQYHFHGIQYIPHLLRRASYTNQPHVFVSR